MPEFHRLLAVASSPIFGSPVGGYLIPRARDPLSVALQTMDIDRWTVPLLTVEAAKAAQEADDFSLVGLAARAKDSVVLAALRESVVIYSEEPPTGLPPQRQFLWQVDDKLAQQAQRFVDTFNALFRDKLPPPIHEYADAYWHAHARATILGRCVWLGETDTPPVRYYHWGICNASGGHLAVQEFWHHEIWTTVRYQKALQPHGRCPEL